MDSSCSSLINPEALKVGATVAYSLILVVSLVGNSLIVLIVYKTPTLRKPINMLIANMAMSDLLYPILVIPVQLTELHVGSWLIGGTLGQALCKIHPFLAKNFHGSVDSEPGSDNSGSICSCCSSTPFTPHQSQGVSLFDCWYMDTRSALLLAIFV